MISIYDWEMFAALSEDVPIIVCDDSDGQLAPPPRRNVRYFDYAAQKKVAGGHYDAIPHKSSACRNFGHYLAYKEGFDVVVALDYDCRVRSGWLEAHLEALGPVSGAPGLAGAWINTMARPGCYARGYPYEYRNPVDGAVRAATASGEVKLNMGVWDNILDLNGIDKLQREPPTDPGPSAEPNGVALGNIPICGMNTAFRAELTPAYFFLPDVWIDGWRLSRHDDIWGGYVLKKLMDRRGDLVSYGHPVVEHTRQSPLTSVVVVEHYMHLLARDFFAVVDEAAATVQPGDYVDMFGAFCDAFRRGVERSKAPSHYRRAFAELGHAMQRWSELFQ
jgi:hypothetical protein